MAKYDAFGSQFKRGSTIVAQVTSISGPDLSADTIDVTTMDSTNAWEEVVVGILRSGTVTLGLVYDPATATHKNAGNGLLADLVGRASTTWSVVFADTGATVWTFSAFVTGFNPDSPVEGALTATVTLKPTGDMTLN